MIDTTDILLVLGAGVIFSLIAMNTNRMLINQEETHIEADLMYGGVAKAQEFIDHARLLPFDETTVVGGAPSHIPSGFTDPGALGNTSDDDAGSAFDDFDDYNGFTTIDTTQNCIYNVHANVHYSNPNDPDIDAGNETLYKTLTVTVSSPFFPDTIRMKYVKSFHE